jgi:Transposase, Mutator family
MGDMEIPDELIDQLLGEYQGPEQLTGPDGLINQLRRRLIERAAGAELEQHLGYPAGAEAPEGRPNRRNGTTSKTLRTVDGPPSVELPPDRDASFEPRIVPKHARSFDGFDEQILALYAGGMTTRDIQRHLRELYGVDVSEGLISEVTGSIQEDVRAWQSRPLNGGGCGGDVPAEAVQQRAATHSAAGRRSGAPAWAPFWSPIWAPVRTGAPKAGAMPHEETNRTIRPCSDNPVKSDYDLANASSIPRRGLRVSSGWRGGRVGRGLRGVRRVGRRGC